MSTKTKRATIYLDSELHKALRIKAAETEHSMSELVNDAIKYSLAEDSTDLAAFDERKDEPVTAFKDVLKKLKKNGKI
ncbi:MAG: CopG family transcriptional regulator [Candidatus Scalindua sp. AMX11]|nr:CopG family transcriptional regulator [Planctomycetota bacterium]RZV60353.1 MAG: CopG family transcriptional regulator [Candidatus Scalindua sp. SCAELEC01]TDE63095.1 MAG: CopG family transcriptional regulator [Candidatus Scalindua sp. AMX11]